MSEEIIHHLEEKRTAALKGGGEPQIEKQHAKGKLTARERIEKLLDPTRSPKSGHSSPIVPRGLAMRTAHPGHDGVVTGIGKVDGRSGLRVMPRISPSWAGSLGEAHGRKIAHLMDLASRTVRRSSA